MQKTLALWGQSLNVDPEVLGVAIGFMALCGLLLFVILFCAQLLKLALIIDKLSDGLGVIANWLVLTSSVISAANAAIRYMFDISSNGWLEIQWYMFAGMVLLGASCTLKLNEHVRVDLFYGVVSDRTRHWIDLLGGVFFLMPMCLMLVYFTWPWFVESWVINEQSGNAGGLARWPVKLLLPVGFALLALQGFSEIVKRAAALADIHQHAYAYEKPLQ